ncbi:hypothetical protein RHSIM_Rhsim01G0104700 [Rhododendron simsii]|uniref:Uncharacterized protein n=1 Tax=Rhododendron simsii TaxID=118357 RepID=A0A834M011_RHOSS|nr:hypothetical protein RHSIM_Rhsim01G0104700 [Rhododendron simsii]
MPIDKKLLQKYFMKHPHENLPVFADNVEILEDCSIKARSVSKNQRLKESLSFTELASSMKEPDDILRAD